MLGNGLADTEHVDNTMFAYPCLPDWVCILYVVFLKNVALAVNNAGWGRMKTGNDEQRPHT